MTTTFFEVEFFIHPDFKEKAPFVIEDAELKPTIDGVDALLEKLLYYFCIKLDIVTQSTIASTIAEKVKNIDNQLDEKITSLSSTIANATTEIEQKVMTKALYPQDRETFFKTIAVTNQRKNYKK